jgi:hypothetical protein
MQRACARVASHVFETRGEVLSVDAFACEIASLRESVSADPAGARRGALREALSAASRLVGGAKRNVRRGWRKK